MTAEGFTYSGLEDQLLGQVVAEERPDLEEAKNQLIISNAKMRQELKGIEDQILYRLSSSEGNPVDDLELIKVLEASKLKAGEIQVSDLSLPPSHLASQKWDNAPLWCLQTFLQAKVKIAEQTEKDIDITRLEYVPVAVRTQILYFCVSDLSNVDPMYQYSLEWFLNIFLSGIANSERAGTFGGLEPWAGDPWKDTLHMWKLDHFPFLLKNWWSVVQAPHQSQCSCIYARSQVAPTLYSEKL